MPNMIKYVMLYMYTLKNILRKLDGRSLSQKSSAIHIILFEVALFMLNSDNMKIEYAWENIYQFFSASSFFFLRSGEECIFLITNKCNATLDIMHGSKTEHPRQFFYVR